jgi:hypothetical protein
VLFGRQEHYLASGTNEQENEHCGVCPPASIRYNDNERAGLTKCGLEGGDSKSRSLNLLQRGQALEGFIRSPKNIVMAPGTSELGVAERVGFEPTVELPRQQFSRLPDSAALAPLRS